MRYVNPGRDRPLCWLLASLLSVAVPGAGLAQAPSGAGDLTGVGAPGPAGTGAAEAEEGARALSADSVRRSLRLPMPVTFAAGARGTWVAPAMTIGVPSGYGADYGDAFAAIGVQSRTRFRDRADGGVVAGFGLGDARRLVGLELAFTSYGTFRSCCRGGLSGKLHRILPGDMSMAVGVENAIVWGRMAGEAEATDAGTSVYVAASKIAPTRTDPTSFLGSVALTVGIGNGRYRRERDILREREMVNAFGSVGVRIAEPMSAVASWTGQDLVAGVSFVPFRSLPLFITPAAADLTTEPRFILGVGYGFNLLSLF